MPRFYVEQVQEAFDLVQIPCPYDLPDETLFLHWHERNENDPVQKWLRDLCFEAVRESVNAIERPGDGAAEDDAVEHDAAEGRP